MEQNLDPHLEGMRFCLELGRALQSLGTPAHRFEELMDQVCEHMGMEGQFMSMPTAFIATIGQFGQHRTFVERMSAGNPNMEKLVELQSIVEGLLENRLTLNDAQVRLRALMARPDRYGPWIQVPFFALCSVTVASVFGGGWIEMLLVIPLGLIVGSLYALATTRPTLARMLPVLCATLIAFLASASGNIAAPKIVLLAGLIMPFPGFKILTSMNELATGNLVSGTARLADAGLTLVQLAFGAGLGQQLGAWTWHVQSAQSLHSLPEWTMPFVIAAMAIAFLVIFQARTRDYLLFLGACLISYYSSRIGTLRLGPAFGAGAAAFIVGAGSNLVAQWRRRPVRLTLLPGLMMLVPGSLGFRSLSTIFQKQVVAGLDTAFQMIFIAAALLAGLLLANLAVPSRKAL
jgi:uncharacterized membrane protein YjjP (DUF1212 family)